jgi:hypothetical protein
VRQCSVSDVQQAALVDRDHPLPFLDVGGHDGPEEHQPGAVDQDVEPPELGDCGPHGPVGLVAVGDVGLDRQSRAARCFDLRDKRVGAVLAAGDDDDVRGMLGKLAGGGVADAAAGAGDERHGAVECGDVHAAPPSVKASDEDRSRWASICC